MKKAFLLITSLVLVFGAAFVLANQQENITPKVSEVIDEPMTVQQDFDDPSFLTTMYTTARSNNSITVSNPKYKPGYMAKEELPADNDNVINDVQVIGDACDDPFIISSLPYQDIRDNSSFLHDYGLPGKDVIYRLTLTSCQDVTISLCNTTPVFDTYLWLYWGNDCGGDAFAEDDDFCSTFGTSEIQITLSAGTYYINVDAYTNQTGTYTLDVTGVSGGTPPANDNCAQAVNLGIITNPVLNRCGTTECATIDCAGTLDWNAVWYKFTLLGDKQVTINYCPTGNAADAEIQLIGAILYTTCPTNETSCEDYILADEAEYIECDNGTTNPMVRWRRLDGPATYYLPVYTGLGMDFCFDLEAIDPCEIILPPNCIAEGEGECYDGYDDDFNSGCNYEAGPPPFTAITDGDTICAHSGHHLDGAAQPVRDTDWYKFDLGGDLREFTFGGVAEFPLQIMVMKINGDYQDCNYNSAGAILVDPCDTAKVTWVGTGAYWLFAAAQLSENVNCSFGNYVCWVAITPPADHDAYVISADEPQYHRMAANSTTDIKATVTNLGILPYDFDVDVTITGDISGEVYTSSSSVTDITQADTVQLTFADFTPDCVENFTMTIECSGIGEENPDNDVLDYTFRNQAWGRDGYHDGSSYWVSSMTDYPAWATRFHVPSAHTAILTSGEMEFHSFEAPPAEVSDITPWICFSDVNGEPDYANLQWVSPTVYTVGPENEHHIVTFDLSSVGPFSQDFWLGFNAALGAGGDEQANIVGECITCLEDAPENNRVYDGETWYLLDDIWLNPSDMGIWCNYDLTGGTYKDGAVISIDSPAPAHVGAGPHEVLVTFANNGLVPITGATASITIGTDFSGIDNNVNIPANSSIQIDFGDWTASAGGMEYPIDVNLAATGDMDDCNDDLAGVCYIISGTTVYSEDFEADNGGYTVDWHDFGSDEVVWYWGVDNIAGANSGTHVWGTTLNGDYHDSSCAALVMPSLEVDLGGGALIASFWYELEAPDDFWDFGNVKASLDDGETFSPLTPFGGYDGQNSSEDNLCASFGEFPQPGFAGHSGGWVQKAFELNPAIYGGKNVIFEFDFASDYNTHEHGWYLDDVKLLNYPFTTGACCIGTECATTTTEVLCGLAGGTWHAGETCPEFVCPSLCFEYLPGDVNMSVATNPWPPAYLSGDVTYLVNYFRGLPSSVPCKMYNPLAPTPDPGSCFFASADVNGSCTLVGADVTKLVNVFRGITTPASCPSYVPCWPTPGDLPPTAPAGWPNCVVPCPPLE